MLDSDYKVVDQKARDKGHMDHGFDIIRDDVDIVSELQGYRR